MKAVPCDSCGIFILREEEEAVHSQSHSRKRGGGARDRDQSVSERAQDWTDGERGL